MARDCRSLSLARVPGCYMSLSHVVFHCSAFPLFFFLRCTWVLEQLSTEHPCTDAPIQLLMDGILLLAIVSLEGGVCQNALGSSSMYIFGYSCACITYILIFVTNTHSYFFIVNYLDFLALSSVWLFFFCNPVRRLLQGSQCRCSSPDGESRHWRLNGFVETWQDRLHRRQCCEAVVTGLCKQQYGIRAFTKFAPPFSAMFRVEF